MSQEIIVNVDSRETRVAIIENARLMELHVEREERVVGSIFKGRVVNILPGMDCSFVDIGLERNAFLYVGDVLSDTDDVEEEAGPRSSPRDRDRRIRDVVRPGQEILVQVVKAPRSSKGARVSTRISLPGRYLVLMPDGDSIGVSRKIESSAERDRLKRIAARIKNTPCSLIVRTEAEGKAEDELRQDFEFLAKLWSGIQERARTTPPPGVVHQDLSLVYKVIRDVFTSEVTKFIIDSQPDYLKAIELVNALSPKLRNRLEHYPGPEPIFDRFGIEQEIERLTRAKVWIRSGGHIAIDETEAFTIIDVNSGKFVGTTSLADTILKTNLDAVTEIARQLRLRDIGGIIVIDFIDMSSSKDRQHVLSALDKALKRDRVRTKIANISPLGLLEMTRKRTRESLTRQLTDTCPYCNGRGRVASSVSMAARIEREMRTRSAESDHAGWLITAAPPVAAQLVGPEGSSIHALENATRRAIFIRADQQLHAEEYRIAPGDLQEMERQMVRYRPGQVVECAVDRDSFLLLPRSVAWAEGLFIDLLNGSNHAGERVRARLSHVHRSFGVGEVIPASARVVDRTEPI